VLDRHAGIDEALGRITPIAGEHRTSQVLGTPRDGRVMPAADLD
jgi:hypothetical protein